MEGLPRATVKRPSAIGSLQSERVSATKTLKDHLHDFEAFLVAKGGSERHVKLVTQRARKIIDGCGFRFYADLSGSKVSRFLQTLREDTKDRRGISHQTFNFYLQALKQFCRWMVKDRRASEIPVAHLDALNVRLDRRHDRRALTLHELLRLLAAAERGPFAGGMSGLERAILYRLSVETGLRANELRSLTKESFNLDAAMVTVLAAYSKRRRDEILPMRLELVGGLRPFLANKTPLAPVFHMPNRRHLIDTFRSDLD